MSDEVLVFDAASSGPNGESPGSPLSVGPGTNYNLLEAHYPTADPNVLWASSIDTDGSLRVSSRDENRQITLRFDMVDSTDAQLKTFAGKVAKLQLEGGTFSRTMKNGDVRIYDVLTVGGWDPTFDVAYYVGDLTEVTVVLTTAPGSRAVEATLTDRTETTLAALIATETSVNGDLPAYARWVIDNDGTLDWWGVTWGGEIDKDYAFTSSSGSGGLLYEAESRTAMGGSATAAGPSGASGAGSNVMRNTALATSFQAVVSSQATGGGAHLTHVGTFRVWARVQVPTSNTGTVSVALEWGDGDFRRYTTLTSVGLDPVYEGQWLLVDLGTVTIPKVVTGTQRWEARLLTASTVAGDDIDVDVFPILEPCGVGSGTAVAIARPTTPSAFTARDEFDQAAGALNGKTLPVGGTWATTFTAATPDFQVGSGVLTVSSTAASTRSALAGAGMATNIVLQTDVSRPIGASLDTGLYARYTGGGTNYIRAYLQADLVSTTLLQPRVQVNSSGFVLDKALTARFAFGVPYTLKLYVDAQGRFFFWVTPVGQTIGSPVIVGYHSSLATGGANATGQYGIYEAQGAAGVAPTHTFDNFAVWTPVVDAAVYAGQSLEVRSDRVIREDSTGAIWSTPSAYIGDYLRVPPAGAEARSSRFFVKPIYAPTTSSNVWLDQRIDDLSARVNYAARYLA